MHSVRAYFLNQLGLISGIVMMENQRKMINDCPLNVPNDGVVATPDDLNGYFSVCADQKDFCTCSPFDIQGMYIILISDNMDM